MTATEIALTNLAQAHEQVVKIKDLEKKYAGQPDVIRQLLRCRRKIESGQMATLMTVNRMRYARF